MFFVEAYCLYLREMMKLTTCDRTLSSAVAVPELLPLDSSNDGSLKRRNSSISEADSKRRRFSDENAHLGSSQDTQQSPNSGAPLNDSRTPRRRQGAADERKRGQRLFGALLGTLSQSSSSAAQKRRADIEKRQQDKLKLQDEEYGEKKRKRREELLAQRRLQQTAFEREAVSNSF